MGQPETIVSTVFTTLFVALVVVTNIPSAEMQECSAGQRLPTFQEFLIFAPKVVRPDMVYEVHVTLNRKFYSNILVTALLSSDGNEYANGDARFLDVGTKIIQLKVPVTVRSGTHKLVVEGLVQNEARAVVTTNASDIKEYASYLPIYHNESYVFFEPKYVSIFVVLDYPTYVVPSSVLFRIVGVSQDLTPATGSMTIYVRDAKGNFVRRWIQRQLNFGLYSGGFDIEYPVNVGDWAIVIDGFGYRYEHPFEVRFWWQRSFEMNVTVPLFMYDSEWGIMGIINGEHPSGEFSYGNTSVTVKMMEQDGSFLPGEITRDLGYVPTLKTFTFSLAEIKELWGENVAGKDLYFLGTMTDYYYLETLTGTAVTHIVKDGIKLKVLGKIVRTYKPGVPFNIQVALMRNDGSMYKGFYDRQLVVTVTSEPGSPSSTVPEDKQIIPDDNILNYEVMPGMSDRIIRITVQHPASGHTVEIVCYRYYSAYERYLALTTSTEDPRTESYMTFTARANFHVDYMNYLIASGGRILLGSRLMMYGKQKTFAVALSRQMAPTAHIVAYCIVEGEVVTDALSFYVRDTRLLEPSISINYGKDFRQDYIELVAHGPPGGYVFTMAVDYEMMWRGAVVNSFLTEQRVLQEMMSYDTKSDGPYQHTWWINDFSGQWEKTVFFSAATTGMDTNTTIDAIGLIVLSDANITINQEFTPCNRSLGVGICPLAYQCYDLWRTCDDTVDCADGYDEITCPLPEDQKYRMRPNELYTVFWNSRYTDPWQMYWQEHYIKQVGQGEITVLQDESMDPLVLGAFFMHPDQGLSIAKEWVQHDTTRSFFMTVEAPDTIRRGEQIGLRLDIFSNWDQDMEVLIMLVGDPAYKFIHVEDFGYVVSYLPRTSFGDFQTMLPLKAGMGTYLMMPIVSTLERGQFTVKLRAFSSQREDYEEFPITVEYDGVVGRYKFTPFLVDLVNTGSLIIPDLKINISERFFDPGARDLLYIPYSGVTRLHAYGDLVSPGMFEDHLTSLNTAWAYHDSGEGYVYEFAVNLQTLNYLQTINLLDDDTLNTALEYMQTILMRQYAYMQDDGSYKMFRRAATPCVRLTSLALKSLNAALVSQWMEILFIPVEILNKMALWLSEQQNDEGAFVETSEHYYDRSFWPNTTAPDGQNHTWHIPITAHVVISLSLASRLTGDAKQRADAAAHRAAEYLSTKIMQVTDPFQMAILTYALQVSHHKERDTAYNRLRPMGHQHDTSQYLYWASKDIPDNPLERINNVEFLYERQFHPNVGSAVMATSYALFCYLAHNDMKNSVPIMKFITSQRNHMMGWSSTSDTLLALESLTEFSYRQTNRAFYNLQLEFDCTSNSSWTQTVKLDRTNFANLFTFDITPTYGEVKTRATGTGYAQLGLDHWVHYEKPYQVRDVGPPYPSFELDIDQQRFWGRNYSHLEMTICFRWIRPDIAPESGMANVIVGIPTGYIISRDTVEWMYRANFTGLQRVRFYMQKLITFFSYVGQQRTCFSFIADRWYPVANTSIDHLIKIQEYAETGLQNLSAYNAFTLFQLHICQVCGSFQCPYCDFYNAAPPGMMTSRGWMLPVLLLIAWLVLFFNCNVNSSNNSPVMRFRRANHANAGK